MFAEPCEPVGSITQSLVEPSVVLDNPGTQSNSDDNEGNDEVISQQHDEFYSPALCEHGLIGMTSQGDCSMYWKCREGYFVVGSSAFCDSGMLFDKRSQECVSNELVDRFCVGSVLQSTPKPTSLSIGSHQVENSNESELSGTYDPNLCAPEFVGFRSNRDCTKYVLAFASILFFVTSLTTLRFYDCNVGFFGSLHSCKSGYQLDRVRAVCVSEELVDNNCFGPEINIKLDSNEMHLPLVTEQSSNRPAESEPSKKKPIIEVNTISNKPPALHPTETETSANDKGHWFGMIQPKYEPSNLPTSSPSVRNKSFWTITDSSPHGNEGSNSQEGTRAWQETWEVHQLNASMQIFLCNPFIIILLVSIVIHI